VRAELLNTRTAGIDTNTLTTFTLLLIIRTQRYMWSLDKTWMHSKIVPADILPLMAKYALPFNQSAK